MDGMSIGRMRVELRNSRYGKVWHKTVEKMTDGEVVTEFYKLLNRKFDDEIKEILVLPEPIYKDIHFTSCRVPKTTKVGISIPYEDVEMFGHIICKKEEILANWVAMVGKELDGDWAGKCKTAAGVKVVDGFIVVDLK